MGTFEKEGGSNRPKQQMANFVKAVNWCGLRDIGFTGPKFTWLYERSDGSQIRERLDRALTTTDWVNLFPMARLHRLTSLATDHSPLVLCFVGKTNAKKPKKLFKFESMWLKELRCEEVVMEAWSEGLASSTNFPLVACLNACRSRLDAWNKAEFGHVGRMIVGLQKHLEWLELQLSSPSIIQDMRRTKIELNCWHEKEDTMWHQRSKINWFQSRDRNTVFFHAKASSRQRKNHMEGLLDAQGVWQEDEEIMSGIVLDYYTNMFTSNYLTNFEEILEAVQPRVTFSTNQKLTMEFTAEEVHVALK